MIAYPVMKSCNKTGHGQMLLDEFTGNWSINQWSLGGLYPVNLERSF